MSLLGTERLNKKIGIGRCGPAAVRGAYLYFMSLELMLWEGKDR